jgi:hypothetical protein
MAQKTHKGQHFVPSSYLKAWCDPGCPPEHEPYVWIFDEDGSNARKRAPSNIFKEPDLYTIEKADGTRDLRLEHGLAGLEDRFVKILRDTISKQRKLNAEDRVHLSAFVAAAQVRTTQSRDHHASQWGSVLKIADDMAEAMAKAPPEQRHTASKVLSGGGPSLTHDQVRQLATAPLQHMIPGILRQVTPILSRMDLAIFSTDDPIGFLTSDNPCCWFDPEAYKRPPMYRGPGLGMRTIEVTMPLSPNQCLLLNWQGLSGYMPLAEPFVDELNRRHRNHCSEHFVLRANTRKEYWFVDLRPPDDAWENPAAAAKGRGTDK